VTSSIDLSTYTNAGTLSQLASDGAGANWVVDSGCKQKLPDSLLATYGYTSGQFTTLPSEITNQLGNCADLTTLVRARGYPQVYKVENGKKRWITSEDAFNRNGFSWSNVRVLSPSYISSLPSGTNIQ
jgi:hypothetical protein